MGERERFEAAARKWYAVPIKVLWDSGGQPLAVMPDGHQYNLSAQWLGWNAAAQPADGAVVVYDGIVERFHAGSVVVREGAASPSYVESGRLSHNLERFHGHRVRVTVARILEGEES